MKKNKKKKIIAAGVNMSFSRLEMSTIASFVAISMQTNPDETKGVIDSIVKSGAPHDLGVFIKIWKTVEAARNAKDASDIGNAEEKEIEKKLTFVKTRLGSISRQEIDALINFFNICTNLDLGIAERIIDIIGEIKSSSIDLNIFVRITEHSEKVHELLARTPPTDQIN